MRELIKNNEQLESLLIDNKIKFEQLSEFISDESIIIDKAFNAKYEYEELYPHSLLKPTQSGLDLQAIAIEAGDNSTDAGCKYLEYRFWINENGTVNMAFGDDGEGIKNHDIKTAVAYGGYFGPTDLHKSGKFMEGLSNLCGSAADIIEIYTSNGTVWYKSTVNFKKLKDMIKIYEESIIDLDDTKKDIYRGISYKYMAHSYIEDPIKIDISSIKNIVSKNILQKNRGTILVFKECNTDVIDKESLNEDVENLKHILGRRYWRDIDNGIKINVIKEGQQEEVKSIDFMMRSRNCNYRDAFNTKYIKLDKVFKMSDFTKNETDTEYISLNVSIKQKTKLYMDKIPKRKTKKIIVPKLLAIGIDHQGLTIERNNRPIRDNITCGLTRHNDYNGISVELCVDSRMDKVLFVTGDKSGLSERKLQRVFKDKMNFILKGAYKVKKGIQDYMCYQNADGEEVKVYPTIIELKEDTSQNKKEESNIKEINDNDETIDNNGEDIKPAIGIIDIDKNDLDKNKEEHIEDPPTIDDFLSFKSEDYVEGLVFASKYKPDYRYDVTGKKIIYKKNNSKYLIYDEKIDKYNGLRMADFKRWCEKQGIELVDVENQMQNSMKSEFQKKIFSIYKKEIEKILKHNTPVLLTEVELFHNSYTNKQNKISEPQRMDFYLILPNDKKVIIEIDGIQHIADKDISNKWIASEDKYAMQCRFDNEWFLDGNEIYRIPNKLLKGKSESEVTKFIVGFFISLLTKHKVILSK